MLGPYRQKKFGKLGTVIPRVSVCVAVPLRIEIDAVAPNDLHRRQEPRGLEAGAVYDHVGGVLLPVLGNDSAPHNLLDLVGDQVYVVALQSLSP